MKISKMAATVYEPEGSHSPFWSYWQDLSQEFDKTVPPKSHLRPAKLAPILPKLTMSEYIDANTQLVRLIGEEHQFLWPSQMTNTNLFDRLNNNMADARRTIFSAIRHNACAALVQDRATTAKGRTIDYCGLILPFLGKASEPTIFVGCYDVNATGMEMREVGDVGVVKHEPVSAVLIELNL